MKARLTYANVVATLCLALLLSGSAYAATQLSKDSVRSKHIKNGTVKSKDLKDGGVTTGDVKDGTLTGGDVADGTLTGTDLKAGEVDAEVAGTPMNGDLAGTFPNPTLDPGLLADLATDVEVEGAIDGVLDDVVLGDRATGSLTLSSGSGLQSLVSLPGIVSVSASCFAAGPNRGMNVRVTNAAGVGDWDFVVRQESQVPALSTIGSDELAAGANVDFAFPPDSATQSARYLDLTVYGGRPLTIEVAGVTSTLPGGCAVRGSVQLDDGPV